MRNNATPSIVLLLLLRQRSRRRSQEIYCGGANKQKCRKKKRSVDNRLLVKILFPSCQFFGAPAEKGKD